MTVDLGAVGTTKSPPQQQQQQAHKQRQQNCDNATQQTSDNLPSKQQQQQQFTVLSTLSSCSANNQQQQRTTSQEATTRKCSNESATPIKMRRTLGVWNGIAIIVGVIVGSGIFISPKGVLMNAGSVGASLAVWSMCGLLALLGALCFAELGTSIAASGGEYTYIKLAYGPLASYLYIWVLALIIMPCSNAIAALTFANYCLQPLFDAQHTPPEEAVRLVALAILMLLIYINCTNLDATVRLQSSFTLAKVLALCSIIAYGAYYLASGNKFRSLDETPSTSTSSSSSGWWAGTQTSLPHLARAFYSGFFTYSGWNSLNTATEEIKSPARNMPRAIVISITMVTLIYILANGAYFAVLTRQEILASDAIAVLFGERAHTLLEWLMPLVVAISTVGGLNGSIFAASRIYFAAAREGQLFQALAMIHTRQLTPVPSLLFLGFTSIAYLCTTRISYLIDYMTFVEASFAALGVSTMLALRYQQPNLKRPLRIPLFVPIVYLICTAIFVLMPVFASPWEAAIGVCITLTGLPAYYLTAKWKRKPRVYQETIDKMNASIQKLTMCVLPARDD